MGEKEQCGRNVLTKLRHYFLNNIGHVVDAEEIHAVSGGIADLPQHVRDLREEEGLQILSHVERIDLRPGQYLLESARPAPCFDSAIPDETRTHLLESNHLHCQMCGVEGGESDEYDPARRLRLHIDHSVEKGQCEGGEAPYLRVLCSLCHEGVSGIPLERPSSLNLLVQVRRATGTAQLDLLAWLVRKFPAQAKDFVDALDTSPGE